MMMKLASIFDHWILNSDRFLTFVYSWAKETVKQKSSKYSENIRPFHLFFSGSAGVGKSHLVKTIYQAVSKLLQYHDTSSEKPRVLILAPQLV